MRRALLYCTFNGVANCTNGIGRQAQTLLSTLSRRWHELTCLTGPFTPFLAIPAPGPATWAWDPARLSASEDIIRSRGGQVIPLPYDTRAEFWSPGTWQQLSAAAATAAARLAGTFDQVAVIAVDTPFAGTAAAWHAAPRPAHVTILLALYGTALIPGHPGPDPGRLAWEHRGLAAARRPGTWVADIGDFMTRHLTTAYRVDPARFLPCPSALDLTATDLQPMPAARARSVLAAHGIPAGQPIIATIGRTDPVKGIDLLIDAAAPLRDQVHLVVIAVPFDGDDPLPAAYQAQIRGAALSATLIPRFSRDLPRALAGLPATRAIACPARGEPLANVPLETALWARHGGPVIVAPDRDGFPEQVTDGATGILYDPGEPGGLTRALTRALRLSPARRAVMCQAASQRVQASRDIIPSLAGTLARLLPAPGPPAR
jgi:glycosyltransferase involved in cell wall biosynthesis